MNSRLSGSDCSSAKQLLGKKSGLSVADSITSFKQLIGGPLTPGSVSSPVRGVTRSRRKKRKSGWLPHGWRPPRVDERAQGNTAFKLIEIHFAENQNRGKC